MSWEELSQEEAWLEAAEVCGYDEYNWSGKAEIDDLEWSEIPPHQ